MNKAAPLNPPWLLRRALALLMVYGLVVQALLAGLAGGAHAASRAGEGDIFSVLCSQIAGATPDAPGTDPADCPCATSCAAGATVSLPQGGSSAGAEPAHHAVRSLASADDIAARLSRARAPFAPRAPPAGPSAT
jgi:hypothetical protein